MQGLNNSGKVFVPTSLCEVPLVDKAPAPTDLDRLTIVAVSGPFTTGDNLAYEPLADFVTYLQSHPPDVCIMVCKLTTI